VTYNFPEDLRYGQDHLWARQCAGTATARVGITDFAQQSLGDVTNVTLPTPGQAAVAGDHCGDIESSKSITDLIAPLTGTVHGVNNALMLAPELVNSDPYGQGWIYDVDVEPGTLTQQLASLMDAAAYSYMVSR
jgi:glycine cleavage system H protein